VSTPYAELPFGCHDARITPWNGAVLGTAIDLPRIRTVELSVTTDSTDLEGDDVRVATHNFGKGLEGSIEAGGINFAAVAAIEGGIVTVGGGVAPNRTQTYKVLGNQAQRYFKLEAQMHGDDSGDIHFIAWKLKATNGPNYSFTQGEFALTACDVAGIFDDSVSPSALYHIVQNESIVPLTP
jgi:hypothetical protein